MKLKKISKRKWTPKLIALVVIASLGGYLLSGLLFNSESKKQIQTPETSTIYESKPLTLLGGDTAESEPNNQTSQANQVTNNQQPVEGETCGLQESIPFKTITKYDSTFIKGTQYSYGGSDGIKYYCVDKSGKQRVTNTLPPFDKTTVVGTLEEQEYTSPPPTTVNPNYGKDPTREELTAIFVSIAPAGENLSAKIDACRNLYSSRGVSDFNFQGYRVCSDYGLSGYPGF